MVIAIPERFARELSIEDPGGTFFQLVIPAPTADMGPQLISSDSLYRSKSLRIVVNKLIGLPRVYGVKNTRRVFSAVGKYRVRVAERLNTDDGTPLGLCEVNYRGGT